MYSITNYWQRLTGSPRAVAKLSSWKSFFLPHTNTLSYTHRWLCSERLLLKQSICPWSYWLHVFLSRSSINCCSEAQTAEYQPLVVILIFLEVYTRAQSGQSMRDSFLLKDTFCSDLPFLPVPSRSSCTALCVLLPNTVQKRWYDLCPEELVL